MPETGIALFGGVRIERDGGPLPAGPAQQRAVLALLALAGGQPVGRAALLSALWPGLDEAPPSAWNIVQTHVKRLRAALEPDRPAHRPSVLLPSVGDGYALRPGPDAVDVLRFRTLVESSAEPYRQGDHAAVWRLLREALETWTAEPAADVPQLRGHPLDELAQTRLPPAWNVVCQQAFVPASLPVRTAARPIASVPVDGDGRRVAGKVARRFGRELDSFWTGGRSRS